MLTYYWRVFSGCMLLILAVHGQSDSYILSSLGDHGDRLSDLEHVVKALQSQYSGFQTEMTKLKNENKQLRTELEQISGLCNMSKCCTPCSNGNVKVNGSQSSLYPSTASPIATTSSHVAITTRISNYTTSSKPPVTSHVHVTSTIQSLTPSTLGTTNTTQPPPVTSTITTSTTAGVPVYDDCGDAIQSRSLMFGGLANIRIGSTGQSIPVYCDVGGWLVIQRRKDGSQNFNQTWNVYKQGFGNLSGEFWLGNENIHKLTTDRDYTLHISIEDWARNKKFVEYEHFQLDSEDAQYRLSVGSYAGNAGDSFHYRDSFMLTHFQMPFSTPDRDNDKSNENCALRLSSGWWFNDCYSSNLNGPYLPRPYGQHQYGEVYGQPTLDGTGVEWYPLKKRQYSLKTVTMKIKAKTSAGLLG